MSTDSQKHKEKKHDKAVEMTFLASDPTAHGKPTGTEPPLSSRRSQSTEDHQRADRTGATRGRP